MIKNEIDLPNQYESLTEKEKGILQLWIETELRPFHIKTFNGITSYTIKHFFEKKEDGFYITNGQMKGALQAAGFKPKDEGVKNWEYAFSVRIYR